MNRSTITIIFRVAMILSIGVVLLLAGKAFAQKSVPATESGVQVLQTNSGSKGQPDGILPLPGLQGFPPAATEGGVLQFVAGQSFQGFAPDDNLPSGKSANNPNVSFTYFLAAGATFHAKSSSITYAYSEYGCVQSTGTPDQLITDMHIPNDSIIKYIRIYYIDSDATNYVNGYLTAYTPSQTSSDLVSVSSAGSSGWGYQVSSEITATVDNSSRGYTLIGWPSVSSSTVQFCGIRVAYYAPSIYATFLPSVAR